MAFWNRDKHKKIKENLSAYLDGHLDPKQAAEVEAHLKSCAECAWEKQTLEQTRRLVRMAPRVAVPRSFVLRAAQVEAPTRRGAFAAAPLMALRAATAAVGILLAVVVAGDLWVRPLAPVLAPVSAPMLGTPPAPAPDGGVYTFSTTPESTATEQAIMKMAAQPEAETPTPAPVEGTAATALAWDGGRGAGAPEATPEVAAHDLSVQERGETQAPFWAEAWIWRAAEGALGAMFVALLIITATGWRRASRV